MMYCTNFVHCVIANDNFLGNESRAVDVVANEISLKEIFHGRVRKLRPLRPNLIFNIHLDDSVCLKVL